MTHKNLFSPTARTAFLTSIREFVIFQLQHGEVGGLGQEATGSRQCYHALDRSKVSTRGHILVGCGLEDNTPDHGHTSCLTDVRPPLADPTGSGKAVEPQLVR